jgi:hypothetical protein
VSKPLTKERITNKEDILTVHAAEIADVHDGDSSYDEVFVCIYLFLAAHITVQRQQGAIAIAIRSPSKSSTSSTQYGML